MKLFLKDVVLFMAILGGFLFSFDLLADGYHYVRPYVKKDGTYVNGHMQGNPDQYKFNNLNQPDEASLPHPKAGFENDSTGTSYDAYTGKWY